MITWDGRRLRHGAGLPLGPRGQEGDLAQPATADKITTSGLFLVRGNQEAVEAGSKRQRR